MLRICSNTITTGLKSLFWLRMKTLCYHLHRDLLLEFLVQLKKMLWLLILWFIWALEAKWSLQAFILLPTLHHQHYNGPVPCASGEKVQRSALNPSNTLSKRIICRCETCQGKSHVRGLECVAVCSQGVCWPHYFFGGVNPSGSSSTSPWAAPQGNTDLSDAHEQDCAAKKSAKCIKYACLDYNVKIDFTYSLLCI